jgi:hypothetical protein
VSIRRTKEEWESVTRNLTTHFLEKTE